MKYFQLLESLKLGEIGKYPQVNNGKFISTWDSGKSLVIVYKKKVDEFNIEIPEIILNNKSKLTDLISTSFLNPKLVISSRVKSILEFQNYEGVQYFNTLIHWNESKIKDYWITNPYGFQNKYIDFSHSEIKCVDKINGECKIINVPDLETFKNIKQTERSFDKIYTIDKVVLKGDILSENFFLLEGVSGAIGYYISENIKYEIEKLGCTGIDFLEIDVV